MFADPPMQSVQFMLNPKMSLLFPESEEARIVPFFITDCFYMYPSVGFTKFLMVM